MCLHSSGKRGGSPPLPPVGRVVYFGVPVGLLSVDDCFCGFFLACCFDKVSWVDAVNSWMILGFVYKCQVQSVQSLSRVKVLNNQYPLGLGVIWQSGILDLIFHLNGSGVILDQEIGAPEIICFGIKGG